MGLRTSLVVSMALAFASFSNSANAVCKAPDPKLVWSSPADGATDVPTNAAIWLLLANWYRPPEILLNGAPVPVAEVPFLYRPAALEPRTRYEVKVTATPVGSQTVVEVTWGFTTGDGPSSLEAPTPPEVDRVSATQSRDLDELCTAVWTDCYDTGQNTHVMFHVAGPAPLAWIVERVPQAPQAGESSVYRLWPGICGTPEIYTSMAETNGCFRSYRVHAGDVTGRTAASQSFCPSLSPSNATSAPGSGCAIADTRSPHGGAGLPFVIWVLVGLFTRRPTRRERASANHL
jgi:hypothetical protein